MLTNRKVVFIEFKALKFKPIKIMTRNNKINRAILTQIARLQYNRVNPPLSQENIGKIMTFQFLKKSGSSHNNHFAF